MHRNPHMLSLPDESTRGSSCLYIAIWKHYTVEEAYVGMLLQIKNVELTNELVMSVCKKKTGECLKFKLLIIKFKVSLHVCFKLGSVISVLFCPHLYSCRQIILVAIPVSCVQILFS